MDGAQTFWAIVICASIASYAAVKITRIITNNWDHEA